MAVAAQGSGDLRGFESACAAAGADRLLVARLALAQQHRAAGDTALAEAVLRLAVVAAPRSAAALTNHGLLLYESGRPAEAAERHRAALALEPGLAAAWVNLALALRQLGDAAGAAAADQQALRLDPEQAAVHVNAGIALQAQGRLFDAIAAYRYALARDPHLTEGWINLGVALLGSGDVASARAALTQALRCAPRDRRAASNLLLAMQYDPTPAASELRQAAAHAGGLWPAAESLPFPRRRAGRLRIGYLSGDFWQHPVGWLFAPLLAAHDRDAVEVHCFDHRRQPGPPDALAQQMRRDAEHWHEVASLDDPALGQRIRRHAIDVLVDLSGHTEHGRPGVLAQRAAPVQLSWLGWFASTGLAEVDAVVLGDRLAGPGAEAFFTEPLERLPGLHFVYQPPAYLPPFASSLPSQRMGVVSFGSFNNPAKLGDAAVALWSRVLLRVPASRLILKWASFADPAFAEHTRRRFAPHGIGADRLELRPASPHAAMLAEYDEIDIAFDPFPFSGLQTTLEALCMGVPVLTLPWQRPVSRQTLAIVQSLGLPELAVDTPQEFVERAAALAADTERRAIWRSSLRGRLLASPLAQATGLARALEAVYARRVAALQAGEVSA
ncbi:MAG: tetratricopeptide repeat protein [Burkholderiaceae bacterium]|nr:tetratricopeptide repeat protein [Burkholderiaceae bacterium]